MVHYFDVLGKLALYTDWNILSEKSAEQKASFMVKSFLFENERLDFIVEKPGAEHCLARMELGSGEIHVLMKMPGLPENPNGWRSCWGIVRYGNRIILAPYNAQDIYMQKCCS